VDASAEDRSRVNNYKSQKETMTVKLSTSKITKLIRLYFQGFTQTTTAGKLAIDQSTVSFYVAEFTAAADDLGLENAAKEFGVLDIVKELHSLGSELKKSGHTVEDATKGLKVAVVLEDCDVPQSSYKDVVKTCVKINNEGFLASAVELHQIEENTGKSYHEIEKQAGSLQVQNQQAEKKLVATQDMIESVKQKLAEFQLQEKGVEKNFKQRLQEVATDLKRLDKIEDLAVALKNAGVTDDELDSYIERQNLLNKSGVPIDIFTQILDATKIPTTVDGGKILLKKLTDFGNLGDAISGLKHEKQSLINQTSDLSEKAKLKGILQIELTHLRAEQKELEGSVAQLHYQEETTNKSLEQLTSDYKTLSEKVTILTAGVSQKQNKDQSLDQSITQKQKNIADLEDLEMKREVARNELAEMETRRKREGRRWEAFEGFLGLVNASSMDEVRKAARTLPLVVEEAQEGKYSPEFLMNYILLDLAGSVLQVCRCKSCGARFIVDKPTVGSYYCPVGGPAHTIVIEKDATATLMKAMEEPRKNDSYTITMMNPPKKQNLASE